MERRVMLHAVLPVVIVLAITACASSKPAPPAVDPVKEQVLILQKQLLELQHLQIETRQKLDEQTTLTETLSSRLKTMEEQRAASRIGQSDQGSTVGSPQTSVQTASPEKKKQKSAVKKKKKKSKPARRQEQ